MREQLFVVPKVLKSKPDFFDVIFFVGLIASNDCSVFVTFVLSVIGTTTGGFVEYVVPFVTSKVGALVLVVVVVVVVVVGMVVGKGFRGQPKYLLTTPLSEVLLHFNHKNDKNLRNSIQIQIQIIRCLTRGISALSATHDSSSPKIMTPFWVEITAMGWIYEDRRVPGMSSVGSLRKERNRPFM